MGEKKTNIGNRPQIPIPEQAPSRPSLYIVHHTHRADLKEGFHLNKTKIIH